MQMLGEPLKAFDSSKLLVMRFFDGCEQPPPHLVFMFQVKMLKEEFSMDPPSVHSSLMSPFLPAKWRFGMVVVRTSGAMPFCIAMHRCDLRNQNCTLREWVHKHLDGSGNDNDPKGNKQYFYSR